MRAGTRRGWKTQSLFIAIRSLPRMRCLRGPPRFEPHYFLPYYSFLDGCDPVGAFSKTCLLACNMRRPARVLCSVGRTGLRRYHARTADCAFVLVLATCSLSK